MAGSNSDSMARRPAVFVGGQRHRLVRRSNLPRSNTTPALNPESSTASLTSSAATEVDAVRHEASSPATSQSMDFHVPNNGLPADFRPSPKSRLSDSSSSNVPAANSPTPTTASASTTATGGKKRQGLFSLKSKDNDRPASSHGPPITSPLPPRTPVKAAQLLGFDSDANSDGIPHGGQTRRGGVYDGPPVRPVLMKQSSMPSLTKAKDVITRSTKFREEGVEPDPPKSKKFWGSGKKAMRMLDFLPSSRSSSRRATSQEHAAASPLSRHSEDDTEEGYSSDPDLRARPRLLPASRSVPEVSRRHMRKKGPKSLDRMAPITETSHDELRTAYRNSAHNTELDVISEYEHVYPLRSASMLPRSHTESALTNNARYELDEDELSPTDEVVYEYEAKEEEHTTHPGVQVDPSRVKFQRPAVVHLRSPLQTVEDRLLDTTELDFEARKSTLKKLDVAKLEIDTEVATLRTAHEKMKKDLEASKQRVIVLDDPDHICVCGIEDSEDDEDLVSIRSSIDLDEEPTIHVAKVMTFTRITPGMVKLVDIPPRKKKPVPPVTPAVSREIKPAFFFEHDERISPFNERSENVEPPKVNPFQAENYKRFNKANKVKMPRDESRMLVQDWVTNYDPTEQRPVSERIDLDVLADQQIPPAPFPKEDRPILPAKQPSKHFCLNNGHIFHSIDLKRVPDEAAINSLEVRPYLQTRSGVKQHVRVPVSCDKCGKDVNEELQECEIPVCRMVVCKECAENMEQEWQERAVGSWVL